MHGAQRNVKLALENRLKFECMAHRESAVINQNSEVWTGVHAVSNDRAKVNRKRDGPTQGRETLSDRVKTGNASIIQVTLRDSALVPSSNTRWIRNNPPFAHRVFIRPPTTYSHAISLNQGTLDA